MRAPFTSHTCLVEVISFGRLLGRRGVVVGLFPELRPGLSSVAASRLREEGELFQALPPAPSRGAGGGGEMDSRLRGYEGLDESPSRE